MALTPRLADIVEIARREGRVTVEDLAARFGVTLQTIRRDLGELADSGKLDRVHGGAILPSGTANIGYQDRRALNLEAKEAIGQAVAAALPDGASIFLNLGTTTEAVAAALTRHRDLMVVTNNMNVANILASNEGCQVIVTGGRLRRSDGGLIGNLAADTVRQFKFDFAVIGCSALDAEGDILDFDIDEVGVSQTIIRQSRRVFLAADKSKFQRNAPARIASLAEVDAFYTDATLPPSLQRLCGQWETGVTVCQ